MAMVSSMMSTAGTLPTAIITSLMITATGRMSPGSRLLASTTASASPGWRAARPSCPWMSSITSIGTYEDLIRAIIYATDNGADVINMSLGATSYSLGEEAAVDYAWNHGVVVVAAAGNTGRNTYHYPAAHRQCDRRSGHRCERQPRRFLDLWRFRRRRCARCESALDVDERRLRLHERHQHGGAARGRAGGTAPLAEPAAHQRASARADRDERR